MEDNLGKEPFVDMTIASFVLDHPFESIVFVFESLASRERERWKRRKVQENRTDTDRVEVQPYSR